MFKFVKLEPIFRRKDAEKCLKPGSCTGLIVQSKAIREEIERRDEGELLPLARSGHRAFFHTGVFYIIGGYRGPVDGVLTDVWRYYPLMRHWDRVEMSSPVPLENLSCASVIAKERVFQFGGSGVPFGEANSDKLLLLDLASLSISQIRSKGNKKFCPPPGYGNSLIYSELTDCLYLCCGTDGRSYQLNVYKFDFSDSTWSILPKDKSCVTPRYRQESFVWKHNWFIIGGSKFPTCFDMSRMYKFSFLSEKWELMSVEPCPLHDYPAPRRGFGSVIFKDRLYVFGGSQFLPTGYSAGDLVQDKGLWYIDLPDMRWNLIQKCTLTLPIDFFAISVDGNGKVLLHGGRSNLQQEERSVQTFIVWLDVPPLIELCWEKIKIWQNENFFKLSLFQLMSYGLPRKLADQVHQFYLSCMDEA